MGRLGPADGKGIPPVGEFACAELGLVMGTGFIAAANLIRDAVDLRHRHPLLWAGLAEGRGRVWKARQVARMATAAGLSRQQAWFLDAATTEFVDTLTWSAFTRLVAAKIIEADPAAAEARRLAAAMERFVATGATNEHGLKTLIAKAGAGQIIYFVAMCDRIAAILGLEGDTDPVAVRRSKAIAVLANPAALDLLEAHAGTEPHPGDPDRSPVPLDARVSGTADSPAGRCGSCGRRRVDAEKLRPKAVLYLRISEASLHPAGSTCTGCTAAGPVWPGVAHVESGVGPVPVGALTDLLGHHRLSIRPVLDLRGQVPVEAYEIPAAMREALRLARPSSVFPYSRAGSSTPDLDHTIAYHPHQPDQPHRPKQTRVSNLGPMVRFGHRVKTFAPGWRLHQPRPGIYLWRTPHGYWFRVDADGTHRLGRDPDLTAYDPPPTHGPMEQHLFDCINLA